MVEWFIQFISILAFLTVMSVLVYAAINEGIWPAFKRWFSTLVSVIERIANGPSKALMAREQLAICKFYSKQAELDMEIWGELSEDTKDHLKVCKRYTSHSVSLRPVPTPPQSDQEKARLAALPKVYITGDTCWQLRGWHEFNLEGQCVGCGCWMQAPPHFRLPNLPDPGRSEKL